MDSASGQEPPRKRARVEIVIDTQTNSPSPLTSLEKPITPPPQRRARSQAEAASLSYQVSAEAPQIRPSVATVSSPFKLTSIQDLPAALNVDTITLKDLLGDPLIAECWEFNFMHDLDFLMEAFDSDVRDMVNVHVVHGFWRNEDGTGLKMQASKYSNVTLHTAYMPEAFGTHHTKMMVLLRHDDLAQIVIHTANLIRKDWTNISQAVWTSPLLPMGTLDVSLLEESPPMGSGSRFKLDFLNYLRAYDQKRTICKPLIEKLIKYDFTGIRAALVASVPGKHTAKPNGKTNWGWQCLQDVLSYVPVQTVGLPEVVLQVSSIATLGQTNQWLDKTLFKSLEFSRRAGVSTGSPTPKYKIIFPTPDEVRKSLDGYGSGASIHTKIKTPAQLKQLQYLRPILNHWAGDSGKKRESNSETKSREAGRRRAAPHIKTYVRFCDTDKTQIDWALVTSANISKQAWGEAGNAAGEVRICSYELGVLVWPELWGPGAKMVPTFKQDMPSASTSDGKVVVGYRMPYDLPLVPYAKEDEPWCASSTYNEPDWRGNTWAGF